MGAEARIIQHIPDHRKQPCVTFLRQVFKFSVLNNGNPWDETSFTNQVIIPNIHPYFATPTTKPLHDFRAGLESGIMYLEAYSPTNSVLIAEKLSWLGWDDAYTSDGAQIITFPKHRVRADLPSVGAPANGKLYEGHFPAVQ